MMRDILIYYRTNLILLKSICKKQESCIIPVSLVQGNVLQSSECVYSILIQDLRGCEL